MDSKVQRIMQQPYKTRLMTITREAVNTENRTVEFSASSEIVVDRGWYKEILDHSVGSIRMGRIIDGAPLLNMHNPKEQIGVIEKCWLDEENKKLRVIARFSKNKGADEIFQDVLDGIRTKISIGYEIHTVVLENKDEEIPTYRITDWEPLEVSTVSIPADNSVGIGRSYPEVAELERLFQKYKTEIENIIKIKEDRNMPEENTPNGNAPDSTSTATRSEAQILADERKRVSEIRAVGQRHNVSTEQAEKEAWSVEKFRGFVLDQIGSNKPLYTPSTDTDMNQRDVKRYSLMNAIRVQLDPSYRGAGFELEQHEEIKKRSGLSGHGGIFVPYQIMQRAAAIIASGTGGSGLVGTDHKSDSFIEMLRNRLILAQLGVQVLPGLVGNVSIPKQTGGSAVGWITEGNNIPLTDAVFSQIELTPKTVAGYEEYTRQMLLQGTPGIEQLVTSDLSKKLAIAVDLAGIQGTGLDGQPKGLLSVDGIGSVAGAGYNYASLIEHQTDVETANADVATMSYLASPALRGSLKTKPRWANAQVGLCGDDNKCAGYTMNASNQVPAATNIFGDYSQFVMGEWGILEIFVNPYQATNGNVRVYGYYTVDFGCRQPGAFSAAKEIVLA